MTERQMKKTLSRIMGICEDLQREGCSPDVVAEGVKAIYELVAACIP